MNAVISSNDGAQSGGVFASKDLLGDGNALYQRACNECLPEHRELMVEVWSPTPWMLDVNVGSGEDRRREIRHWCNRNLGHESSPIHGHEGDWHEGNVTMHGRTWYGFKTEAMMKRFEAQFPSPNDQGQA
jgi:hypothetical protein